MTYFYIRINALITITKKLNTFYRDLKNILKSNTYFSHFGTLIAALSFATKHKNFKNWAKVRNSET